MHKFWKVVIALAIVVGGGLIIDQSGEMDKAPVDLWSIVHFFIPFFLGYVLYINLRDRKPVLIGAIAIFTIIELWIFLGVVFIVGYEFWEWEFHNFAGFGQEYIWNAVFDILIGFCGLILGGMFAKRIEDNGKAIGKK